MSYGKKMGGFDRIVYGSTYGGFDRIVYGPMYSIRSFSRFSLFWTFLLDMNALERAADSSTHTHLRQESCT